MTIVRHITTTVTAFAFTAGLTLALPTTTDAATFGPNLFDEDFSSFSSTDPGVALHSWASVDTSNGNPAPSLDVTEQGSGGTSRSTIGEFATVGNRTHRAAVQTREPSGGPSSRFANIQNISTGDQTGGFWGGGSSTTSFVDFSTTFGSPNAGAYTARAKLGASFANNERTVLFDNFAISRSIAAPVVSSVSPSGPLDVGTATTLSLFNAGGDVDIAVDQNTTNNYDIFFDPDITVTSSNGTVSGLTWVSDTQIDLTLTPASAGDVYLTLTNQNGDGIGNISNFTLQAVPEPASLAMGLIGFGALALRRKRSA